MCRRSASTEGVISLYLGASLYSFSYVSSSNRTRLLAFSLTCGQRRREAGGNLFSMSLGSRGCRFFVRAQSHRNYHITRGRVNATEMRVRGNGSGNLPFPWTTSSSSRPWRS